MRTYCIHDTEYYSLLGSRPPLPFNSNGELYYYINNQADAADLILARKHKAEIISAFDEWNYEIHKYSKQFVFTELKDKAYIQIYFVGGSDGVMPEDRFMYVMKDPRMIAVCAPKTGLLYINARDINWAKTDIPLKCAITHEVGHLQNIAHTTDNDKDIMFFEYIPGNYITQDSKKAIKKLYAKTWYSVLTDLKLTDILLIILIISLLYNLFANVTNQ